MVEQYVNPPPHTHTLVWRRFGAASNHFSNFLKLTIQQASQLHAATGWVCRIEKAGRVWTSFLTQLPRTILSVQSSATPWMPLKEDSWIFTTSNVDVCYIFKHFILQTSYGLVHFEHTPALRISINKTNMLPYNYIMQDIWLPNFAKAPYIVTDILFTSTSHCTMLVDNLSTSNRWDHCWCNMKATRTHQKGWGSNNGPIPHWSWIGTHTHLLQTAFARFILFFTFPGSFLRSGAWWWHKPNLG